MNEVKRAKMLSTPDLLDKSNVVGVGVGYKVTDGKLTDNLAVIVLVEKKMEYEDLAPQDLVPDIVWNQPTDVIQVGKIKAQGYTARERPIRPGISIGHYNITAGTLGVVVYSSIHNAEFLLSNNHVFADTNAGVYGDPIYQPGPYDGGDGTDIVATLTSAVEIGFGPKPPENGDDVCPIAETYAKVGNALAKSFGRKTRVYVGRSYEATDSWINYIDAALARPVPGMEVAKEIKTIGAVITRSVDAEIGMRVMKSGRTTEVTTGEIVLTNATVKVDYGKDVPAIFDKQIISGYMSKGGDSGSLLITDEAEPKAVGLLFAGSNVATIYNPIDLVLEAFGVRF